MPCTQATVKVYRELYTRSIVWGYRLHKYYQFKYCWIEVVTDYLFQVLVSPISIDVHKGGIRTILRFHAPSCNERIQNRISKTAKIWTEQYHTVHLGDRLNLPNHFTVQWAVSVWQWIGARTGELYISSFPVLFPLIIPVSCITRLKPVA